MKLWACTDRQVFDAIVQGDNSNTFIVERVQLMLSEYREQRLYGQNVCLAHLGRRFKIVLNVRLTPHNISHSTLPVRPTVMVSFELNFEYNDRRNEIIPKKRPS